MSTKFISVNGFEKIEGLETSKQRKRTTKTKKSKNSNGAAGILLTILFFILIVPVKAFKNFSFKEFISSLTPKKAVCNILCPIMAIIVLVFTVGYWTNYVDFGLSVQCRGESVATVTDTGVLEKAKEITNDKLTEGVNVSFIPVYQMSVINSDNSSTSADLISDKMVSTDNSVSNNVAGLYINNKLIGASKSQEELTAALNSFLADDIAYYDDETDVEFYNKVEIKSGIFNNDDIMSVEDIIKKAEKKNLLQVLVKTDIVIKETTPYSTKIKTDKSKSSSYSKVVRKGKNGKQKTTYRVSYLDGKQIDAVITNIKTVKKPINKVIVKGKSSGSSQSYTSSVSNQGFMWPVPSVHTISSGYGYRDYGEFHTGIDIANGSCYGATIVASMYGTVEWAGYDDSGYGNYVIINHGNGYKTLYGHCSAVYVSTGQSVSQGQSIASIGNTGQSYGAHLHFEVRTGDQRSDRQNPMNYVSN